MKGDRHNRTENSRQIKRLQRKLSTARRDLEQEQDREIRTEIAQYIDDLKSEMAWTFLDSKEYEKGLALYSSISWKTHGEAKFNGMTWALTEMEHYDEARRLLEKGLRRFPKSYVLWVARGVLDQRLGYNLESLRCFQFALRYVPKGKAEALFNVGSALYKMGYRAEAVKVFEGVTKKYPGEPRYFLGLAASFLDMGYPNPA